MLEKVLCNVFFDILLFSRIVVLLLLNVKNLKYFSIVFCHTLQLTDHCADVLYLFGTRYIRGAPYILTAVSHGEGHFVESSGGM